MKLEQFPGLHTTDSTYEVGFGGLRTSTNIDHQRNGGIARRPGRVKVYTGTIQAAWGDGQTFLFVESNLLKQLNPDYSATVLAELNNAPSILYGLRTAMGRLYWSTGQENGVIEAGVNRAWVTADDNLWSGTSDEAALVHELHQDPMPVGKQMIEFAGRIWVVYENMLLYTHPYSETTDLRENFFPIGERITNIGAVSDGIFITTDSRSYFLLGTDPLEMTLDQKAPFGAIPNTLVQADGRFLGEGQNAMVLLWTSSQGICVGYPNGTLVNMTERDIAELSGNGGTAFLRELNGQKHYIAVLQN